MCMYKYRLIIFKIINGKENKIRQNKISKGLQPCYKQFVTVLPWQLVAFRL